MKKDHESRAHNRVVREDMAERIAKIILALQPAKPPLPSLVPIVESFMTRAGNDVAMDTYDFRVKLRNDGPSTIQQYRIEVEIPKPMRPPRPYTLQKRRNILAATSGCGGSPKETTRASLCILETLRTTCSCSTTPCVLTNTSKLPPIPRSSC